MGTAGLAGLLSQGRLRRYSSGAHLVREGDEDSKAVLLIEAGAVKVVHTTSSGRLGLLAVRGPNDIIGEQSALDGEPPSASVVALGSVRARVLAPAEFRSMLESDGKVAAEVAAELATRLRHSDQRAT